MHLLALHYFQCWKVFWLEGNECMLFCEFRIFNIYFKQYNCILSLQFISAGSHAGKGGDIEQIIAGAKSKALAYLSIIMYSYGVTISVSKTSLVSESTAFIPLLESRYTDSVISVP